MRRIRSFLPLLCLALLYWGCQKADNASHASITSTSKPTTTTINVPEHVVIKPTPSASGSKVETDAINVGPTSTAVYEGYTKTYNCTSNTWTYLYTWTITLAPLDDAPSGTGQLTIGSYTTSAAFTIVGSQGIHIVRGLPTEILYTLQYTLTAPNDNNYCSASTLQELLSYSYEIPGTPRSGPITVTLSASNSENITPNVYQTYNDIVAGFNANGNGTFTLDVTPGVTVCGTACNAAIGFPPTVTFYYSLEGSGTWQSVPQAGTNLAEFFITLPQAGTYDYYTQEDTAPGVLSGQLGSGSVTVQ